MPVKLLGDGTARFYYKNEDGTYTDLNKIHDVRFTDIAETQAEAYDPYFIGQEYVFKIKYNRSAKKIIKEHKRWINCIGRLIRRKKRLKEQERRSMLKWRALHHDGE